MKSKIIADSFDYSKYEAEPSWSSSTLQEYEFWGIHKIGDRIHIDIQRYLDACKSVGITDFIPEGLLEQDRSVLFIPDKKHRDDYVVNIFNDLLNVFEKDWNTEYKPIFHLIKTPQAVYNDTRLSELAYTSNADDFDEIEINAMLSSFRRQFKYNHVIQSLYCQFITKLATETDRIMLIAMCKLGYKRSDYDFKSFAKFTDGLVGDRKGVKISHLDKYNEYNMLHKINNFLKHNTISSYMDLKRYYPDNVRSIENGTANVKYENGMFAGDWIIVKEGYIDDLIKKLRRFFKDYCNTFVKENINDAKWNYDDYFLDAYNKMRYPSEYFGI